VGWPTGCVVGSASEVEFDAVEGGKKVVRVLERKGARIFTTVGG